MEEQVDYDFCWIGLSPTIVRDWATARAGFSFYNKIYIYIYFILVDFSLHQKLGSWNILWPNLKYTYFSFWIKEVTDCKHETLLYNDNKYLALLLHRSWSWRSICTRSKIPNWLFKRRIQVDITMILILKLTKYAASYLHNKEERKKLKKSKCLYNLACAPSA